MSACSGAPKHIGTVVVVVVVPGVVVVVVPGVVVVVVVGTRAKVKGVLPEIIVPLTDIGDTAAQPSGPKLDQTLFAATNNTLSKYRPEVVSRMMLQPANTTNVGAAMLGPLPWMVTVSNASTA